MSDFSQPSQQRDFPCPSCGGRIFIPVSLPATTAPCPHCHETITSPPPTEPQAPAVSHEAAPRPQSTQTTPAPTTIPRRRDTPSQAGQTEPADPGQQPDNPARPETGAKGIVAALLGIVFLILASGATVFYIANKKGKDVVAPSIVLVDDEDDDLSEDNYIRFGWQKDAKEVLEKFIAGTSVREKLPFVHKSQIIEEKMENFYGGAVIDDTDTPAEFFADRGLSEEDRKRGMFLLAYDQPPQLSIKKFFRPIASIEVQTGLEEVGPLLRAAAQADNFAIESVTVYAFFKKTDEGLKLDWEMFAQTKYRTLSNFVEIPDPGAKEIFRVMILEDVPEDGKGASATRTYRITDPAHLGDSARIDVELDTETGRTLSSINWRGNNQAEPVVRTATVELEWITTAEGPELKISRFICWEFLGLGGKELTADVLTE